MKKHLGKAFIAALSLLTLASCGDKEAKTEARKKTVLKLAHWDTEQQAGLQIIIDEFKKTNPDIDVIMEISPWAQYWTKLETTAAGGTTQDIFWINAPQFQRYAKNGQIAPLDDLVKNKDINPENYISAMVDTYTIDGKLYALPKDIDSIALWYNKEIFDKAGLQYPNDSWTWKDMEGAAERIKNSTGNYGVAFHLPSNQESYWNVIYSSGGEVISSDKKNSGYSHAQTLEGIKSIRNLIDRGISPSLDELVEIPAVDLFSSGKAGMFYGGTWRVLPIMTNESIKNKVDSTTLPAKEKKTSIVHGLGYAIYAKGKNIEASKKFIAYLGSKEANVLQAQHMGTIPAFVETQDGWLNKYSNINMKAYLDIMNTGTPYPATYDFSKWNGPQDDIMKKVWSKEMDPEQAVKSIATVQQKILDQEKN